MLETHVSSAIMETLSDRMLPIKPSIWLDRSRFLDSDGRFPFSISMLSWGFNEEENIVEFLRRSQLLMNSLGVDYEHILIDDGSTDRTYELAAEVQKTYPQLKIVRNGINMGSGYNTMLAVSRATKEVLFWQTVDWSYDISRLGVYVWYLRDYDVVQGVRVRDVRPNYSSFINRIFRIGKIKVSKRSDNFQKAVISVVNYLLIRTLFRVPLLDFQNVTIYPTKLAQSFSFESRSAFSNPEMLFKSYWKGASIKQVPINFIKRQKGEAKGTRFHVVVKSFSQVIRFWIQWVVLGRRPDKLVGKVFPPTLSR